MLKAISGAALLGLFCAIPAGAVTLVTATNCANCTTEMQWQQMAIGQGVGQRYLYNFPSRQLRKYDVVRTYEPELHRYTYFASPLGVESGYSQYFFHAADVWSGTGGLAKAVVLNLPQAINSGRSGDSVFDMFRTSGGATQFGDWLGGYMGQYPLNPDAQQVRDLIVQNSGLTFASDPTRITVTVTFKDGRAQFKISDDEQRYTLVPDSAKDSDGNTIPASRDGLHHTTVDFPGGESSPSFRGWHDLLSAWWGVTLNTHWVCGTASGGGTSSQTCVLSP